MVTERNMIDRNGTGQAQKNGKSETELSFYWQHYGLNQDPFSAMADQADYFPLPEFEHHLDLLQHLINSENVLLAVIGGEGLGKTTLVAQFAQMYSDSYLIHSFQADSLFSTRKLVRELEAGFGLKAPNNETPEEQLDVQIADVQHKENTCLLIIDDAHFLPLETLNSLLFLLKQQSKNQMRLHIILFGDKNLQTKLVNLTKQNMNNDSEIIHMVELMPLTLEETKQYVQFRLNKAGLNGDMPLSQIDMEKIYASSGGIIDKINRAAQQALLEQLKKHNDQVESSMFKRHQTKIIGGSLLVVVLIAASYVLNNQGQTRKVQHQQAAAISFANQSQLVAPPPQVSPQNPSIVTAASVSQNTNNNNNGLANTAVPQPLEVAPSSNQNTAQALTSQASLQTAATPVVAGPSVVPPIPALVAASAPVPVVTTPVATKTKIKTHAVNKVVKPQKPIQLLQLATVPTGGVQKPYHPYQVDIIAHPKLAKKFSATVIGTPETKLAKVLRSKGFKLSKSEEALLSRQEHDFTLQVLGVSYEKSMISFIKEHHLEGDTHYIKTTLHGKPWFILIYGIYKTQQQASNAISTLPPALRKYQPWPRTLGSIKLDMDKG